MRACRTFSPTPAGSLALLVDGKTVSSGSNLDLGRQGVTWFALGQEYAPRGRGYADHLYIDNATATSARTKIGGGHVVDVAVTASVSTSRSGERFRGRAMACWDPGKLQGSFW